MDICLEFYEERVIFENIHVLEMCKILKKCLSFKTCTFCLFLGYELTCSNIEY